jgi:hypothetical protein
MLLKKNMNSMRAKRQPKRKSGKKQLLVEMNLRLSYSKKSGRQQRLNPERLKIECFLKLRNGLRQ